MKITDLSGRRYGKLTVTSFNRKHNRHYYWNCMCDCGKLHVAESGHLKDGNIKSCGCLRDYVIRVASLKHGRTGTTEHRIWAIMRQRCTNSNNPAYKDYGGRGIFICERWQSFITFLEDMGPRPSPEYSLDRIDNNGPYSPNNCRWATRKEQANNRRGNTVVELAGRRLTLTEWMSELGVSIGTYRSRIKRGWSREDALIEPSTLPRLAKGGVRSTLYRTLLTTSDGLLFC